MNHCGARAGMIAVGASRFGALPTRHWSALCAIMLAVSTGDPAAAQTVCPAAGFTNSRAEPPLLDAFTVLFRQNGVSFHARVETDQAAPGGRLVIRNGNTYDVELSYDVVVTGSAAPVSAEGRCARIRAGEYAVDADANTVIRYDGGTPAAVRVRNLRMARAASAGEAIRAAAAPGAAAPATPTTAASASRAELNQYRCGDGGAPGQRACSTAFMAAAARAAAGAGRFTGTTRECLLEYAALQESAAGLIRAAAPRGDSLRLTTPACYNRGEARWGYEALAAACPHGAWTAANSGRVDCAAAAHLATTDSLRRDSAALPPNAAELAARGFTAGLDLLQQGFAPEAEAEFRQALTLTPADPSLHAGLGTALARQQRWTEAEAAYRAAVWLDPSNLQFADMLRGLRARGAPIAQTAVHDHTGPARALSATRKPSVTRRVDIPALVAATFKIVFATALTAAGLLLFFPVLSALYLALLWGGGRILRLGT